MKKVSRTKLAHAVLRLLEKHPRKEVTRILAEQIIKEKRTNDIEIIVREIGRLMLKEKNHLTGQVESARSLTEAEKNHLDLLLKKITGAETVALNYSNNKKFIGGFLAKTPVVEIDATVSKIIHQLKA